MVASLSGPVWWFLLALVALVAGFSAVPLVAAVVRPGADLRDYAARGASWRRVVGALVAALLLGPWAIRAVVAVLAVAAARELAPLLGVERRWRLLALAGLLIQGGLLALGGSWALAGLLGTVAVLGLLALQRPLRGDALVVLIGGPLLGAAGLLTCSPLSGAQGWSDRFVFLVFLVQFNDLLQYVFGKLLGRTPLAPVISPRKTWEGFLGGAAASALLGAVLSPVLAGLSWPEGLVLGVILSALGLLGDLWISAIKRAASVKDTGTLLPGFGGILDRADSLILAAPAFVAYLALARALAHL